MEVSSHVVRILWWELHTLIPFGSLGAKKIFVNFILNNFFSNLSLRFHMSLCVEESMLWQIVHLSIFDASDCFCETSGVTVTTKNILTSTSHNRSLSVIPRRQVSVFLFLYWVKLGTSDKKFKIFVTYIEWFETLLKDVL